MIAPTNIHYITDAKRYIVADIKGYARNEAGDPIETTFSPGDQSGIVEHFETHPVTSVILDDFIDDNSFEVDLYEQVTRADGTKKELGYTYEINGLRYHISLVIHLKGEDSERLEELLECDILKLPAEFNPSKKPSILF